MQSKYVYFHVKITHLVIVCKLCSADHLSEWLAAYLVYFTAHIPLIKDAEAMFTPHLALTRPNFTLMIAQYWWYCCRQLGRSWLWSMHKPVEMYSCLHAVVGLLLYWTLKNSFKLHAQIKFWSPCEFLWVDPIRGIARDGLSSGFWGCGSAAHTRTSVILVESR